MKRILVVDDEPFVLYGLCDVLWDPRGDWSIETAMDADEARRRLRERDYDVIICDLHMPGEGGDVLLRYAMAQHPRTARVVLSGDLYSEAAMQLRDLHVWILEKPCSPEALRTTIQRAIAERTDLG